MDTPYFLFCVPDDPSMRGGMDHFVDAFTDAETALAHARTHLEPYADAHVVDVRTPRGPIHRERITPASRSLADIRERGFRLSRFPQMAERFRSAYARDAWTRPTGPAPIQIESYDDFLQRTGQEFLRSPRWRGAQVLTDGGSTEYLFLLPAAGSVRAYLYSRPGPAQQPVACDPSTADPLPLARRAVEALSASPRLPLYRHLDIILSDLMLHGFERYGLPMELHASLAPLLIREYPEAASFLAAHLAPEGHPVPDWKNLAIRPFLDGI